ncbi:hypothetical protein [Pleionea sp. CnH1-48]|uniref:hypothetical protein n=1 Tax=Pleionea sp. CnH1-48 TaxID=2954494 RepID=UPI002096B265|nr:hypothetical protein [Pleionea sp. CnH1-48]MCO7224941.1 hypothetical protein [Pleionea sp. CnH1-48]
MLRHSFLVTVLILIAGCSNQDNQTPPPPPPPEVTLPPGPTNFVTFESGAVRPVAMSPDGAKVFVTNTPNHSLDVFAYDNDGQLTLQHSVPVGIEPVAVAARNNQEVWVVNHISDSISIVRFDNGVPYVARTLLVGDEPRDIVFARDKAFITTAHRGQHRSHSSIAGVTGAGDPQLHTPGVGRADVWVFDASQVGASLGGTPLKIIELFGDTPRALAVTPDQSKVYAAVFNSGNQTSIVHEAVLCYGYTDDVLGSQPCDTLDQVQMDFGLADGKLPGGRTAPGVNKDGVPQPWTSMIVKFDPETQQWRDTQGRNFTNAIRFSLPDQDVFEIDATRLEMEKSFRHVGTTLFNMVVNPQDGTLYVTNTESNNATRFEGPGIVGGSTVQGNIAPSRITRIKPDIDVVSPRPLNRHIDYLQLKAAPGVKQHTVANPTQMAISADGKTLYVAAMGSNKVARYQTEQLDDDSLWDGRGDEFDSTAASANHFSVAGGPVGLLLNETRNQLLVYTRFDNSLVSLNPQTGAESQRLSLFSPEPQKVQAGRAILYDADRSSSNGEASCASCHVFGDTDHLAWNLGNPDASNARNPQPYPTANFLTLGCIFVGPDESSCELLEILNGDGDELTIASMKGPMMTQTLRGMSTHGHLHWRGDRSVGYFGDDVEQTLDERTSFKNFIVAFEGLLGLDIELPATVDDPVKSQAVLDLEQDMNRFADFVMSVQMPPNPVRLLDNSLSSSAQIGRDFFVGERRSDGLAEDSNRNGPETDGVNCEGCHGLDPAKGFYGTRGEVAHGGEIQILKVPQLRSLYTRAGMFGLPDREGFLPSHTKQDQGEQIRGFGFLHDGATDQLINFLRGGVFDNGEEPCADGNLPVHGCEFNEGVVGIPDEQTRQGLVDFMMEFDSDISPIVGQQITLNANTGNVVIQRLNLLEQRAAAPFTAKVLGGVVTECDLVAQGRVDGRLQGFIFHPQKQYYIRDKKAESPVSISAMRSLAMSSGNSITFTCQVPGMGVQMAVDRDLDGILNGDEVTL